MKLKITLALVTLILLSACGSSEKVITNDGQLYTIKGKKIYQNDTEVTESLSSREKSNIFNTLDKRLDEEKKIEEEQKRLEKEQERLEKAQKEAKRRQEKLEKELKEKNKAREDYLDAKKELADARKTYEKRLKKGKLSPNDIEDWEIKFEKLKKEVNKLERAYKKLK